MTSPDALPDPEENLLPDFGQQVVGYDDPHPWLLPLLGGLVYGAFMLMIILGKAPWQS